MNRRRSDRFFFFATALLVVVGLLVFASASLGLLSRSGATFTSVAFSQLFLGLFLGGVALLVTSNISYRFWRRYSFPLFLLSVLASIAVFIPGLGLPHGGATRWLSIGSFSFQPAEFLKFGSVVYISALLSSLRREMHSIPSMIPLLIAIGIVALVLIAQPDTGTLIVILAVSFLLFFVGGGRWLHIFYLTLIAAVLFSALIYFKPYLKDRIMTFLDPARDPSGSSWQVQQSLNAIGSGDIFGRGFGQSIQKFQYLPEPIGDSIFAVAAEEFGFVGSVGILLLFAFFCARGMQIAARSPDYFSGLLVLGLVILITFQSLINIASMLGVFPLTGLPLLFMSHGGTALFFSLLEVGIILNVSKSMKRKHA